MIERLEHAKLEQLTLHNNDVIWFKKEKEIIVNSILFDVHSYSGKEDSMVFVGLYDIKETEIKRQVAKLLEQKSADNNKRELIIAKLILQPCIAVDDTGLSTSNIFTLISGTFVDSPGYLLSTDISFPSPPPEL